MSEISGHRDGPYCAPLKGDEDEGRGSEESRGSPGLLRSRDDLRQQIVPVTRPGGVEFVRGAAGALDHAGSVGRHRVEISIARTHGVEGDLVSVRRPGGTV